MPLCNKNVTNIENLIKNRAYSFATRASDGSLYGHRGYFNSIERREMRMLVVFFSRRNGCGSVVFAGRFRDLVNLAETDNGGRVHCWNGEGIDCPAGELMPDRSEGGAAGQGKAKEGGNGSAGDYIGDAPPEGFPGDCGGEG